MGYNYLVILLLITSVYHCYGLETVTVAPLNSDNPVSNEKFSDNKDLKKHETRFNDPPPEYYK